MRPLRLILKNFKPFEEEQVIDFSNLDFFVIRGPTGSGKSSILDAITFALYGPKNIKGQKYEDLVHKGSRHMKVDFTFKVRGTTYRIEWQVSGSGTKGFSGEPRFYVDGTRKLISTKALVKEIEKILGVNREQFQKIFYLPQGRYDQFLKGDARQRREILISLLDLDIYQRISERAKEERRNLEKQLANIEGRLQSLGDISEELLASLKVKLPKLKKEIDQLSETEKGLEKDINLLEEKRKLLLRYRELKEEIQRLKSDEIKNLERRVKELKPLYNLYGEISEYINLTKELKTKKENLQVLKKSLTELLNRKNELEKELKKVQNHLKELLKEEGFIEHLKVIEKELLLLIKRLENLSKEREKLKQLEEDIEKNLESLESLRNKHSMVLKKIETLQKELEEIRYDPQIEIKFHKEKLKAEEKRNKEQRLKELEKHLETLQKEVEEKLNRLKKVEKELEASESKLRDLRKLKKEYLAYLLLQEVKEGETCPVCGNIIKSKKRHLVGKNFNPEKFEELEHKIRELQDGKIKLQTELENLKRQIEEKREEMENLRKELEDLSDIPPIEDIEKELRRLKFAKERKEQIERELNKLLENLKQIEIKIKTFEGSIEEKKKQKKELKEKIDEETANIKKMFAKFVREFYRGEPPKGISLKVFLQTVRRKISTFEENLESLKNQKKDLEIESARIEEKISSERKLFEELKKEISKIQDRLSELKSTLSDLNIEEKQLTELLKELKEFPQLETELNQKKEKLQQKELELKNIEQQMGNFSEDELKRLETLKNQLKEIKKKLEELKEKEAILKNRIKETETNLRLKKDLERDKELLEEQLTILETVIKDFQSNNLIDFVIGTALNDIVEIASDYFYRLSERYRFENQKGNILVRDLYNNTVRVIESLSGGETFLASLSFALGLGEFLGSSAAVESLFIDEGFGTLDRETLTKIGELFGLVRERINKTVGVITHVETLADLFDQQIHVIPSPKGSKIEVINVR